MPGFLLVLGFVFTVAAPAPAVAQSTQALTPNPATDAASHKDLKADGSGNAPAKVEVRGWDPADKKEILGKADDNSKRR